MAVDVSEYRPYPTCPRGESAAEFIPKSRSLPVLAKAADGCRGCSLYCNATQAVFGRGPKSAMAMFVGEQPGDQEDLQGLPFVGPSGKLLDEALVAAGIDRDTVYVTNAVKHFKWQPRGKRRLHAKPTGREIAACRPWLQREIEIIHPPLIICLGATAAQSLMGNKFRLTQHRGEVLKSQWAPALMATMHPSAVLRSPDAEAREQARKQFFEDLGIAGKTLRKLMQSPRRAAV